MALIDKLTNIADAIREKTGSIRTMNRFYFDGTWYAWRRHVNEDEVETMIDTKLGVIENGTY